MSLLSFRVVVIWWSGTGFKPSQKYTCRKLKVKSRLAQEFLWELYFGCAKNPSAKFEFLILSDSDFVLLLLFVKKENGKDFRHSSSAPFFSFHFIGGPLLSKYRLFA